MSVYVHGWYGQGTYYADDFSLTAVGAIGFGFDIRDQTACAANPNVVYASNTVTGGAGASTIPVTSGG